MTSLEMNLMGVTAVVCGTLFFLGRGRRLLASGGRRKRSSVPHQDAAEVYRQLSEFDLSLVKERYAKKYNPEPGELDLIHEEFCRYFTLITIYPHEFFGMTSEKVDNFWHELILCTNLYRDFCNEGVGRFVDHDPGGSEKSYRKTVKTYESTFGKAPDDRFWPKVADVLDDVISSLPPSDSHSTPSSNHHSSDSGHHGHSCGGHSCGGHSCGGHSCGGH